MLSKPSRNAKCAHPAATYVAPMIGHVLLDHAMSAGDARSSAGPTTVTHSNVPMAMPDHTESTTRACVGGSSVLTNAPRYPGATQGASPSLDRAIVRARATCRDTVDALEARRVAHARASSARERTRMDGTRRGVTPPVSSTRRTVADATRALDSTDARA